MFCKNCGKQISENSTFCKYCGSALPINKNTSNNSTTINHIEDTIDNENGEYAELATDASEKVIAVLKQSYLGSETSGSGMEKNVMILTKKWLHVKGKRLMPISPHKIKDAAFITGDIMIPLSQITGIGFASLSLVVRKVIAFMDFLFAIILLILLLNDKRDLNFLDYIMRNNLWNHLTPNILILIILVILVFIFTILGIKQIIKIARFGKRVFFVDHIGGPTQVLVRWYSKNDLERFRLKIMECIEAS